MVIICGKNGSVWVEVHEDMCASNTTQLGLDVTNRDHMNKLRK